jgi:Holliday junction resolvase
MLAKRVDINQKQLFKDLRKLGCVVTDLSKVGKGVPDILVSYQNHWYVFEIKNPEQAKSNQQLTKDEQRWVNRQKAPVYIITDIGDAIDIFYRTGKT